MSAKIDADIAMTRDASSFKDRLKGAAPELGGEADESHPRTDMQVEERKHWRLLMKQIRELSMVS